MILLPHKPKRNRRRTNPKMSSENNEDRLSNLPDSIIHHILSFLKTKEVFQTCVLSTRWIHLTKHLPFLKLCSESFTSSDSFTKSVSQILSSRDDSTPLPTLHFHDNHGFVESKVFQSIVEFAVSHRVQLLGITITC
ncbi:putative F-box domain-containing protein [Medicago truncatula]|uniref:Putative F-box domain-containing protein n=1 Tax=Medicago truncatula TaxID=3880 RepID=A0A396INJ9_MEDTR|nr:putative F-box domain-containing protein [Medicago truncatula]